MRKSSFSKSDIKPNLVKHLAEAKERIVLAIGWFDNQSLLGLLQKKTIEGVSINLLLITDKDSIRNKNFLEPLVQQGATTTYLDVSERERMIDHKFVIIDQQTVITGNYNWGYKNAPKEEFVIVTEQLPTLVQGFMEEFEYLSILNQLSKTETRVENSLEDLLKKMEVLKVLLSIGDTEFIDIRLKKLEQWKWDINVGAIYTAISDQDFDAALDLIRIFIDLHQPLLKCVQPPIDNLRREIQRLEEDIALTSQEFNETQKVIHEFSKIHTEELGDLLQEILLQNKIKAEIEVKLAQDDPEKQAELDEARKDHEEYNHSYAAAQQQKKFKPLTPKDKKLLKTLYRQASLQCHPDRIVDDLQDEAERLFVELNQAYKSNDLEKVQDIHQQLKKGIMLRKSETITELKKLETTINNLHQKLKNWNDKLEELRELPTYQTVNKIDDWMVYFSETKVILQEQLERLTAFNRAYKELVEMDE